MGWQGTPMTLGQFPDNAADRDAHRENELRDLAIIAEVRWLGPDRAQLTMSGTDLQCVMERLAEWEEIDEERIYTKNDVDDARDDGVDMGAAEREAEIIAYLEAVEEAKSA